MSDEETDHLTGPEDEAIDSPRDDEGDDIQGDEEDHPEEEKIIPNPLDQDLVADSLSKLCKTGDGLSHAYVQLDIHDRELTNIEILQNFIHLRYVDVSKNLLKDISPLNTLTHLLTLKAEENLLTSAKMDEMPFLQVANFSHNKITNTEGINHPMLEHLNLSHNNIRQVTGLDGSKLSRLHTVELRSNKIESLDGIALPNLKNLFVAANLLKKIEGMSRLPGLCTLHLRENQIDSLEGFSEFQTNLQYINLRGNAVPNVREISKLKVLPMLRAIVLSENPCAEEDDYRLETLIAIRTLERLDKDEYNPDERTEAETIAEARRAEEEEKAILEAQIMEEIEITEKSFKEDLENAEDNWMKEAEDVDFPLEQLDDNPVPSEF